MNDLKAAFEAALSGQGRLIMLAGEAGIGKTRTAQEFAAYTENQGAQVFWGRCFEGQGAPPYWPWTQGIRSYLSGLDTEQIRSEMGTGATYIADIIPELKEELPDLVSPPRIEPEQDRFNLFTSITTFLKRVAQSRPLVLFLDDLHWADPSSLQLLHFVAREMREDRLLVLGTYRDMELSRQHRLSETLGRLSREPVFQQIVLRGFVREDVVRFIETATQIQPSQELVEAAHSQTEGNPFFLAEVMRFLSGQGMLTEVGTTSIDSMRVPEGIREVIAQRLNKLSPLCVQILTVASVIGKEFEFRVLKALNSDTSEDELLEALDEALIAHVLADLPDGEESYQFSHSLIQRTLAEELSTSRKVRLHARIGHTLEDMYEQGLYKVNLDILVPRLAYHFTEAEPAIGTEKLVYYSLIAGGRAISGYAWDDALIHFERALAAKEGQPNDVEKAKLLFGLAIAKAASLEFHQLREVVDTAKAAFDCYVDVGEVSEALNIAEYQFVTTWGHTGEVELIAKALTLVKDDSLRTGRLLARYGRTLQFERNDYKGAKEALTRARAIAQSENDLALERQILGYMSIVDALQLHWRESLEYALQTIELARHTGFEVESEFTGHFLAVLALIAIGEPDQVRPHLDSMLVAAERAQTRYGLTTTFHYQGVFAQLEGDLQAACEYVIRGLELSPNDTRLLEVYAILQFELGDFERGEYYLEQLLETERHFSVGPTRDRSAVVLTIATTSYISGNISRFEVAEEAADDVLSSEYATPFAATTARIGLALIAAQRGDVTLAETLCSALRHHQAWASVNHVLGLLCVTMGKLDEAMAHFEENLAFCRKAGYLSEKTWIMYEYADALLRRNGPGDHKQAMPLLEEALATSSDLGMRPLMNKVIALQAWAESKPAKALAYPDGLSEREVEVLRLIASGHSNASIGSELFISPRTVANHVTNIFTKTGVNNRAEAATYAVRHGIVSL